MHSQSPDYRMAASRDELVEQHDALAGGISQRMAQAKAQAASDGLPFDAEKWATGRTSAAQFKYGAPYYPVVRGVPSLGQAVAGMNAFDYSRVLIWGGTSAAIGAVVGWRYKRWLSVEASTVAGFFGVGAGSVCVFQGTWGSMLRLTGWAPNGNPLRPGYAGYVHDAAPAFVKMPRHGAREKTTPEPLVPDAGNVRV